MARRILLNRNSSLSDTSSTPSGYSTIGYEDGVLSEKTGSSISPLLSSSNINTIDVQLNQSEFHSLANPGGVLVIPAQGAGTYIIPRSTRFIYTHVTTPYRITTSSSTDVITSDIYLSWENFDEVSDINIFGILRLPIVRGVFSTQNRTSGEQTILGEVGWQQNNVYPYNVLSNSTINENLGLKIFISQSNAGTSLSFGRDSGDGTAILRIEYELITI